MSTLNLNLPAPLLHQVEARAAEAGYSTIEQYVQSLIEADAQIEALNKQVAEPGTPEWASAFDAWASSHPRRDFLADDSRDAIYGDERD